MPFMRAAHNVSGYTAGFGRFRMSAPRLEQVYFLPNTYLLQVGYRWDKRAVSTTQKSKPQTGLYPVRLPRKPLGAAVGLPHAMYVAMVCFRSH
jgi:hypothetical protein